MAGIIQAARSAPGGKITPQSVQAQMHLNPQQQQQVQRIVIAGMKVMFSPQTRELLQQALQAPGDIATKLGQAIAGLMALLVKESQGSIPQQLLIPAGMILLTHAADFLRKAGMQVSDQDVAQAMQVFIETVLHAHGVNPDAVANATSGGQPPQPDADQGSEDAEEAQEPPAEEAQESPDQEAAEEQQEPQDEELRK
jgi:hypothetical protein